MGEWKHIEPYATENEFTDPQFYLADPDTEWTIGGDGSGYDVTRDSTYHLFGPYCGKVELGTGTYTTIYQTGLSSTLKTISVYARRSGGGAITSSHIGLYEGGFEQTPDAIEAVGNGWYRVSWSSESNVTSCGVWVKEDLMRIDGVQCEPAGAYGVVLSTYCDGTQEGCTWDGAAHESASTRSARSRAGGRYRDLKDYFGFGVAGVEGLGASPRTHTVDEYATLPGGHLNSIRTASREFTLIGPVTGDGTLLTNRQALIKAWAHDAFPKDEKGWQPVTLRYDGADVRRLVKGHYIRGLEGRWDEVSTGSKTHERLAVRFAGDDPATYFEGEDAETLDWYDSASTGYIIRRNRHTGQWDNLSNPSSTGQIFAIAEDDTYIYLGGNFTNWNGDGNADRFVGFNKDTEAWVAFDGGMSGSVYCIAIAPNGDIYAGGNFATAGGSTVNNLAYYDQSTSQWTAVGGGTDGIVQDLTFDLDGNLWIVGAFTQAGAVTRNYIAYHDGSSWNSVGSGPGLNNVAYAVAVDNSGNVVIGGSFTAENGGTAGDLDYIASWDGSSYTELGDGTNGNVLALAIGADGSIYAGGTFTQAGGNTVNNIARYYGTAWRSMNGGVTGVSAGVGAISIGPDGAIYLAGTFTAAGGLSVTGGYARYNGSTYIALDIKAPSASTRGTIFASNISVDPVTPRLYDLWLGPGSGGTGTSIYAGKTTVANDATLPQYPILYLKRSGGTSAVVRTLRNESAQHEIAFDMPIQDGEEIVIDLHPSRRTIMSSFWGNRGDAVLPGSDFGEFSLLVGDNDITFFIEYVGAQTITSYLLWRPAYDGVD